MAHSKDEHPSASPAPDDRVGQAEALRSGAAGAGVVRPVPVPDDDVDAGGSGFERTGGRVTTVRQETWGGTFPSLREGLDALKRDTAQLTLQKAGTEPDVRVETTRQADGQVVVNALISFTEVKDD